VTTPFRERLEKVLPDRYLIEAEVERGIMVLKYRAHDRNTNQPVAIKVLRPELGRVLGGAIFRRKCELMSRLDHPHIVKVLDAGETDGVLYLLTPYLDGQSLRDLLRSQRRLPLDDALRFTCDLANALRHAHERGVVVGGLHPADVTLVSWRPVISDIPLAYDLSEGEQLLGCGSAFGNPLYMSPELVRGDLKVDVRTDIYSLGVLLYEMIAGEPPFEVSTDLKRLIVIGEKQPPLLTEIRPGLPTRLSQIVATALANNPDDRFQTAQEFVDAVLATVSRNLL